MGFMSNGKHGLRPCAVAFAVALALGLSGCGGGGGGSVRPSPPPSAGSGGGAPASKVLTVASGTTYTVASGSAISEQIALEANAVLDNAGAVGGMIDTAVTGANTASVTVLNHDGGSIKGQTTAVAIAGTGTVTNSTGGTIQGGKFGLELGYGGQISNDGADSVIGSTSGVAIQVSGQSGTIQNTNGGTITGGTTAVYLQYGGSVTNGSGSIIETTGTTGGDCGGSGDCAIFVASDSNTSSNMGGALTLANAGTIIGNVQMIPMAMNSVTLTAGGSIHGDLDIGSSYGSFLTLNGAAGTTQLYSRAITGNTTFVGHLSMSGPGTWIIDNDDLAPNATVISGGTLQVGNGGATGSIGTGAVTIYHGSLVFDRSDNIIFNASISSGNSEAYNGTLVKAGTGTLTLTNNIIAPTNIVIQSGTLQIGNTGGTPGLGNAVVSSVITNNGALVFDSNLAIWQGPISGTGSVTQEGSAPLILEGASTYSGGTSINGSVLQATNVLPGSVTIGQAGALDGYSGATLHSGVPGVAGDLANAGRMLVHAGDTGVGGNYTQASTGTLAVSLGSKLAVTGTATLNGGTLEVTGADSGYVANTRTDVLTATGGVNGTFAQLVKDNGVVFTSTTIQYDANSVWLDTTGLNVTTAAAGAGVSYTPASMSGAVRVQGAFEQLDSKVATNNLSSVPSDFLHAAGQFQQAPTLQAAQASLQSLSGELHAASAAMTFEAIDASNRALSDHLDSLLDKRTSFGVWTRSLNVGGDMARTGYDGVGFQLNGWLVGSDRQIGRSGVAGFAFGQSQGLQQADQGFGRDNNRSTESMVYAGWLNGNWYTQGRVGFGHFQQDVNRQILLGYSAQGVSTRYSGNYNMAYGESGLYLNYGGARITPFVDVEYASIDRGGFAEQGAGGFGLRSGAQALDRWQSGLGVRADRHWDLGDGRALNLGAHAQWQRTLASHGGVFDASFVGLQQWQPLTGIGLSRYSGLFGFGLDATLSTRTALNFSYDYEMSQRASAQMLSARFNVAF